MKRRGPLLLLFLALAAALPAAPVPLVRSALTRPLPTPPLTPRTLHLLRVIDPAFPSLTEEGWTRAKAELAELLHGLYNLDVTLQDRGVSTPREHFRGLGVSLAPPKGGLRDALVPPPGERRRFVERIRSGLEGEPPARISSYLPASAARSLDPRELAEAVCRTFESRAASVLEGTGGFAADLDAGALGLVTMAPWGEALRHAKAPEVIVTNVPVMYSWRDGAALHALVRGGLIGGFATFSGASRFKGGAMITIFPLLSPHPALAAVGGQQVGPEAAARATAALMAHELSHLMFHVGDNYTHEYCLMHPPPGLDYHRWWFELAPVQPCPACNRDARIHEFARQAGELADAGRTHDAVASYARAVAAAPGKAELLNEAAWFCAERGIGLELAMEWARAGVRAAPRAAHIVDTLGWIEALTGRSEDAVAHLLQARDLAGARDHGRGEITYHLAMALLARGRWTEALSCAREAISQGHRPPLWKPASTLWERLSGLLGEGQRFF